MLKAGFDFTVKIEFCYIFVVHLPRKAKRSVVLVANYSTGSGGNGTQISPKSPVVLLSGSRLGTSQGIGN
jgi:hypothetical protein